MGSRMHFQDPKLQKPRRYRGDFWMDEATWKAMNAFREEQRTYKSHAIRMLLCAALRQTGHLAPLRTPEDATHLEDAHGFPWRKDLPTKPGRLVWFSKDPTKPTWATLLRAMEDEKETPMKVVCARHGVTYDYAFRVFRRYDLWRRGEDHRPRLDPFAGLPRPNAQAQPRPRRKKTNGNPGHASTD